MTLEDVLALPDRDDCRYEVEEGHLIELSLPMPGRQLVLVNLMFEVGVYLRANPIGRFWGPAAPFILDVNPSP